ncbi:MAG: hypothetical protein H0U57_01070 [Tatlockia sp.]|nr:hypothetical protein [Tatlockia sp.]
MQNKMDTEIFNFLLTQKSVTQDTPYDLIEKVIQDSIYYVKANKINARIANIALNINSKLVLAQVYVERQNGFVPTKEQQYGTTPTSYNVQIRFPFGMETMLNQQNLILPSGDFKKILNPYLTRIKVADDVQRDFKANEIILGQGVIKTIKKSDLILECEPNGQRVQFKISEEMGAGYDKTFQEFAYLSDYNMRLKKAEVYPLFYSSATKNRQGLLFLHNYEGYTENQNRDDFYESKQDGKSETRLMNYRQYLDQMNEEILASDAGQYWNNCAGQKLESGYLFNITIVNGTTLFTDSGLPVTRLRDYQLELFSNCQAFINDAGMINTGMPGANLSGKINMGVGAGKTFFTFTLLQYLNQRRQKNPDVFMPSFCLAPDEAVAEVTKKSINRQGLMTGLSASAISDTMPDSEFMAFYETISKRAALEAEEIDEYLNTGLQSDILNFCNAKHLHPLKLLNLIYAHKNDRIEEYKDSIDVKRLLLLVEGQKTIKNKSGMLGITALANLCEQFVSLKDGITANLEKKTKNSLFADVKINAGEPQAPIINYNQEVELPTSMQGKYKKINITQITQDQLLYLLNTRHKHSLRAVRDELVRISCLKNSEAAILLANSGGLGNSFSEKEIEEQIARFLPDAIAQLKEISHKKNLTASEQYRFYLYLGGVFSTIPASINLKDELRSQGQNVDAFEKILSIQSLKENLELVDYIYDSLKTKLNKLSTIESLGVKNSLKKFKISPETRLLDAANQLAGLASMQLTGTCVNDDAKLLSAHIHVFTPEGMANYFEHLATIEQKPKVNFIEHHGIYVLKTEGKISKKDVQLRMEQFLKAIMIADEIHKEEFKFLFDADNPFYQRISKVTKLYLGKEFKDILPHRIGMSGTMNEVAENAFGTHSIYSLSTPKMMQKGLMKKVSIDSQTPALLSSTKELAKQVVIDYFSQTSSLSLINVLGCEGSSVDLFALSKGLIFSKVENSDLNQAIVYYFNLLIRADLQNNEPLLQTELFKAINQKRAERCQFLQNKLDGKIDLTTDELNQIGLYNRTNKEIIIEGNRIKNGGRQQVRDQELNPKALLEIQRKSLQNNLFAIYMEYVLSKSSAPKELSDIIGLQNNLFEKREHLIDIPFLKNDDEIKNYISLMETIDTKSITQTDVTRFVEERIKDIEIKNYLIQSLITHKNNHRTFANSLLDYSTKVEFKAFITTERNQFESGKTMAMLGSASERTGYSHEPVGIIIDVPVNYSIFNNIKLNLSNLSTKVFEKEELGPFIHTLEVLAKNSFSYDEKNQAGGRALRTPYGQVKFVEYLSDLNQFVARNEHHLAMRVLKMETQFQDIFTSDELKAQEERESIRFNRESISLLGMEFASINEFYKALCLRYENKLVDPQTSLQYVQFIEERIPLLWSMKHDPELAISYFNDPNELKFAELKDGMLLPIVENLGTANLKENKSQGLTKKTVRFDNDFMIEREQFYLLLNKLKQKTDLLIAKGNIEFKDYDSDYKNVGQSAAILIERLETAAENFYKENETFASKLIFKRTCEKAISGAEAEFGTHRGWGAVNWIIKGILGVLAALPLGIPAAIVGCTSRHGYLGTFFGEPLTDSAEELENFKVGLGLESINQKF